jgi:hypothetical protein
MRVVVKTPHIRLEGEVTKDLFDVSVEKLV